MSGLEATWFLNGLAIEQGRVLTREEIIGAGEAGRCALLVDGLCSVHTIRPFACRSYFCDPRAHWQQDAYERWHARIRSMHEQLRLPYVYWEWGAMLLSILDAGWASEGSTRRPPPRVIPQTVSIGRIRACHRREPTRLERHPRFVRPPRCFQARVRTVGPEAVPVQGLLQAPALELALVLALVPALVPVRVPVRVLVPVPVLAPVLVLVLVLVQVLVLVLVLVLVQAPVQASALELALVP